MEFNEHEAPVEQVEDVEDVAEEVAVTTPAPADEKKTAEHWARAKGMLPEFAEGKQLPNAKPKQALPLIHNPKFAHFHAAKHGLAWPIGMELTEAEFDKAIADTQAHVYR